MTKAKQKFIERAELQNLLEKFKAENNSSIETLLNTYCDVYEQADALTKDEEVEANLYKEKLSRVDSVINQVLLGFKLHLGSEDITRLFTIDDSVNVTEQQVKSSLRSLKESLIPDAIALLKAELVQKQDSKISAPVTALDIARKAEITQKILEILAEEQSAEFKDYYGRFIAIPKLLAEVAQRLSKQDKFQQELKIIEKLFDKEVPDEKKAKLEARLNSIEESIKSPVESIDISTERIEKLEELNAQRIEFIERHNQELLGVELDKTALSFDDLFKLSEPASYSEQQILGSVRALMERYAIKKEQRKEKQVAELSIKALKTAEQLAKQPSITDDQLLSVIRKYLNSTEFKQAVNNIKQDFEASGNDTSLVSNFIDARLKSIWVDLPREDGKPIAFFEIPETNYTYLHTISIIENFIADWSGEERPTLTKFPEPQLLEKAVGKILGAENSRDFRRYLLSMSEFGIKRQIDGYRAEISKKEELIKDTQEFKKKFTGISIEAIKDEIAELQYNINKALASLDYAQEVQIQLNDQLEGIRVNFAAQNAAELLIINEPVVFTVEQVSQSILRTKQNIENQREFADLFSELAHIIMSDQVTFNFPNLSIATDSQYSFAGFKKHSVAEDFVNKLKEQITGINAVIHKVGESKKNPKYQVELACDPEILPALRQYIQANHQTIEDMREELEKLKAKDVAAADEKAAKLIEEEQQSIAEPSKKNKKKKNKASTKQVEQAELKLMEEEDELASALRKQQEKAARQALYQERSQQKAERKLMFAQEQSMKQMLKAEREVMLKRAEQQQMFKEDKFDAQLEQALQNPYSKETMLSNLPDALWVKLQKLSTLEGAELYLKGSYLYRADQPERQVNDLDFELHLPGKFFEDSVNSEKVTNIAAILDIEPDAQKIKIFEDFSKQPFKFNVNVELGKHVEFVIYDKRHLPEKQTAWLTGLDAQRYLIDPETRSFKAENLTSVAGNLAFGKGEVTINQDNLNFKNLLRLAKHSLDRDITFEQWVGCASQVAVPRGYEKNKQYQTFLTRFPEGSQARQDFEEKMAACCVIPKAPQQDMGRNSSGITSVSPHSPYLVERTDTNRTSTAMTDRESANSLIAGFVTPPPPYITESKMLPALTKSSPPRDSVQTPKATKPDYARGIKPEDFAKSQGPGGRGSPLFR